MHKYSDNIERKLIVRFFSSIGFSATFLMACVALINDSYLLSVTLYISSAVYVWAFCIYTKTEMSASAILYNLYALMIYLVLTGGAEGTGPIWIFIVSPVTFSIRGLRRGVCDIILFLSAITLAFYCAESFNIYSYEPAQFPYRIILSFILVALLSGYYEHSRSKYSDKIIALSQKNELLATIDPLTNLPNRRYTMNKLTEFKSNHLDSNIPFVLLLADVDNFKKINDTYGHDFGDEALIHLANIFKESISENTVASRWGGEEFLIALPNASLLDGIKLAESIHGALRHLPINTPSNSLNLTLSIGVIQSVASRSIDLDIKSADELLYKAKKQGKNQTCSL